jgi:HK97 family phage portal protein
MKGAWNDVHKGAANGHRLAVLTESAKWTQTSLSPEDASYIRGLEHGIQDVARLYGLPPFLLADTSRATSWGSGLHEMNVAMVQYSLRPLANKVSAAFTSIMRSEGIAVAYARFDVGAISRAGNERWETYSKGIQMGVYSIDEVRNLESMAPLPNGEGSRHYIPLNLAPVDGEGFPEE